MLYNRNWDFPVTPYGVLAKAGGIMDQYGLAKNRMLAEDGSVCIHGAVMLAVHGTVDEDYFNPLYLGALHVLADHLKMPWGDLAAWSNRPLRRNGMSYEIINGLFGKIKVYAVSQSYARLWLASFRHREDAEAYIRSRTGTPTFDH